MEKELLEASEILRSVNPELSKKLEEYAVQFRTTPDLSQTDRAALRHLKKRVRRRLLNNETDYKGIAVNSWVFAIEQREKELGVGKVGRAPKSLMEKQDEI